MHDTTNYLRMIALIPILSVIVLYLVIKMAVRDGIREATGHMMESIQQVERSLIELNMRISKKESE